MEQKTKLTYFSVIILSLALGLFSIAAVAKNDNGNGSNGKSNKSSESKGKKKVKKSDLENFKKPDQSKGETHAKVHKEKTEEVVENLEQAAEQEKVKGNTEVSNQIQEVVQEQQQSQIETTDAIEKVEKRGKVKTFLIGTDYKNLGQLRSNLVHNRNEIRKLTQALNQTQDEATKAQIQAQLTTLMQERERIKTVIQTNEEKFSLFGWVAKFLTGYEETPIDQDEEDDLTEEVEGAINDANSEDKDTPETDDSSEDAGDLTPPSAPGMSVPTTSAPQTNSEAVSAE